MLVLRPQASDLIDRNYPNLVCTGKVTPTSAEFDALARVLDITASVRVISLYSTNSIHLE